MVFLHDAIELLQGKQGKHFKVPPDIRVRGSQEKLQELQLHQHPRRSKVIFVSTPIYLVELVHARILLVERHGITGALAELLSGRGRQQRCRDSESFFDSTFWRARRRIRAVYQVDASDDIPPLVRAT